MSKIFQNKNMLQKIAIVLLITLLSYFIIPTYSFAGWGGDMLKVLTQLLAALGDAVMGAMNHFMLGTDRMISSVMLSQENPTITESGGALNAEGLEVDITLDQDDDEEAIDGGLWGTDDEWQVPNLLYSPEAIFSNRIAALDVNFLRPNKYEAVQNSEEAEEHAESAAGMLQETIGSWYVAFRNIAIVALLTVLVYIAIRILISSTSSDKAKYKESLKDWLFAVFLVFVLHFIMSGILMISDQITTLFDHSSSGIVVEVDGVKMKESLMGVARLRVQSTDSGVSAVYCIIYLVLVVYTIMFTYTYLKRFLYMAFLTMIAPLVAITYPIDKMGDSKAQAFNLWFKEYLMNAILQPIHLILYTTLVTSAMDLVKQNFIYALVAIGFLVPAEKFIKTMFKLDKASTPGTLGGFAAGALAMNGLGKLAGAKPRHSSGGKDDGSNNRIKTVDTDKGLPQTGKTDIDGYDSFNFGGSSNQNQNQNESEVPISNGGGGDNSPEQSQQSPNLSNGLPQQMEGQGANVESDNQNEQNIEQKEDGYSHLIPGYNINDYVGTDTWKNRMEKFKENSPAARTVIRGVKAGTDSVWRNKGKIARKLGRGLKAGAKVAASGALGVAGAGIGLAAGIATGDMSKAFSYAGAGLASGSMIGKNVVEGVTGLGVSAAGAVKNTAGTVKNTYDNIQNAYNEEKYGYAKAEEIKQAKINEKAKKEFMQNKEQLALAKKTQIKLAKKGQNVDINDIMNSRYDFVASGIKNNDYIQNAQLAEAKNGGINGENHKNYVAAAQVADKLGITEDTFTDDKRYNEIHDTVSHRMKGEENGAKVMELIADTRGKDAQDANKLRYEKRKEEFIKKARENQNNEDGNSND